MNDYSFIFYISKYYKDVLLSIIFNKCRENFSINAFCNVLFIPTEILQLGIVEVIWLFLSQS